jgi:hypothetical protein
MFLIAATCIGAERVVGTIGDPGDGDVGDNVAPGSLDAATLRVGTAGSDVHGQSAVFFFALPKLPWCALIAKAELQLSYQGVTQGKRTSRPDFNVNLFGLDARPRPVIRTSDYFDGEASRSKDALVAANFITPATSTGRLQVSNRSLLDYVNSLYQTDGTPTGAYAVFRASPDIHLPSGSKPTRGFELASGNNTGDGGVLVPRLRLTLAFPSNLTVAATSVTADSRLPVPTNAELGEILTMLKDLYGREYEQARTYANKAAIAQKLLARADQTKTSGERFALLRLARDIAAGAANAELGFQSVNTMAKHFQVDDRAMKVALLNQTAARASTKEQQLSTARCAQSLQDDYVATNSFEPATQSGQLALQAARQANEMILVKQIAARNRQIDELGKTHATAMSALAALKKSPSDATAGLVAGRYLCFAIGDWQTGLPFLAIASDPALKDLAAKDLAGAESVENQVELGDRWWARAESDRDAATRSLERAGYWYAKALPNTSGLVNERLVKRLDQCRESGSDPGTIDIRKAADTQ